MCTREPHRDARTSSPSAAALHAAGAWLAAGTCSGSRPVLWVVFAQAHYHTLYAHSTLHSTCLHCIRFSSIPTTFAHLPADDIPSHSFTFHDIRNTCTFECILRTFSHKHIRHTLHALTTHLHTHSLWAEHIPVHSHRPPRYSAFRTSNIPVCLRS